MKRARFTESQIVEILKEADAGWPPNEVWQARDHFSHVLHLWTAPSWQEGLSS